MAALNNSKNSVSPFLSNNPVKAQGNRMSMHPIANKKMLGERYNNAEVHHRGSLDNNDK